MSSLRYNSLWTLWIVGCYTASIASAASDEEDEALNDMKQARAMAKPWLMRSIQIGGTTLPFSPASVIALTVLVVNIAYGFVKSSQWCEASHILIKDTSAKTKKALDAMVTDIGGNARKFGDIATKYSQCPSKTKKGDLGRFSQGDMAPPFDRACFDPNTKLKTTIGPIETHFGYHLIYIRNRKL